MLNLFGSGIKYKISSFTIGLATLVFTAGVAMAQGQYVRGSTGVDVSYPNCSQKIPKVVFGIVGVNGGLNFSKNPCLASQSANFKNLSLYVNTGYPGQSYGLKYQNSPKICSGSDLNCLAYNYGYNAGLYSVNYANSLNVRSSTWWLDVENVNSWTNDPQQNRNSLQGQYEAIIASGASTVGAYSTTAQWNSITGTWRNNWPSWGATTWTTAKQASKYCTGHEFTGGPSYLMQYKPRGIDQDYAC